MKVLINFLFVATIVAFQQYKGNDQTEFVIENASLSRTVKNSNGKLHRSKIVNKINGQELVFQGNEEFRIRIYKGTHIEWSDVQLTSNDFSFVRVLKNDGDIKKYLIH